MVKKTRKLTKKQKLFIALLPKVKWVGSEAVKGAGFKVKDNQSAAEIAYQLLQKTPVREAIDRDMSERLRRIGVHSERVLMELARVALSDLRNLYKEDGSLKLPHEWSDEAAAAVAGVEVLEEFEGRGEDRTLIGHTKKVRTFDKVRALEILAKNLGIIGNGKHRDEDEEEGESRVLTTLELSAKIVYLVKLAVERKGQIEAPRENKG